MVKRISSGSPFEAKIGYSRAVVDQDMVYVSGTTGYDYKTMTMPDDAVNQARNALKTIAGSLEQAGSSLKDVVRVRYYITDMAHYEPLVAVAGETFGDIRPAATMVVCGLTTPEMKLEIEVTARIGAHQQLMAEIVLKLDPDQSDIDPILVGLIESNRKASGREAGYQPFALHLIDPTSGEPVGGLSGWAVFDWVFIELFHLPEAYRGLGHGRALMNRAEQFAREQGCVGIWLDTFDFQARPFYEKLGFTVFGTIEDHPVGGFRYFLSKRLETPSA